MEEREDKVRKSDQIISRVVEMWPIWALLASGVVAGINFYTTVNSLAADQKAWKVSSEARREKTRDEMEAIRTRLSILETKLGK